MRFVFTSYIYSPGFKTPETWLKRINAYAGIQEALGKKSEVISIEQIDYEGTHTSQGVNYRFKKYTPFSLRFFPLKLSLYIKKLKPDVVVVQSLNFPLQTMLLRIVLGKRVKIIVQNHAERPANGLKKRLQKLADKGINAYLFASYAMGVEWVAAGNLSSGTKIHEVMEVSSVFYPVDNAVAMVRTAVSGNPVFLWVGRLDANKDPGTVVKAFLTFAKTEPHARLYMIYHTEELLPVIKALIAEDPLHSQSIQLIGRVPHHELLYWFNSADFILSGSYYEGSGTSVCEAMSCGCIPIVTDILSYRMITNNGYCGLLYPAGDEKALLKALHSTRQMDLWEKKKRSLDHFHANLSFDAIAKKIHDIAYSL
jgi:glycosyltransferase involved in cell wall biosynthesis